MQRLVDESEYVLGILRRMRNEVSAKPKLFDPDAQKRIDEAIAGIEDLLRSTRSGLEQNGKAA